MERQSVDYDEILDGYGRQSSRFFNFVGRPMLVGKALSFTDELSFFLFLWIHRAQRPHSGWPSNVFRRFGRGQSFNNWYRDLAHPPLIFTGGQKVRNLASFSTLLNFERLAFENVVRHPNAETNLLCRNDRPMSLPSLVKFGHAPMRTVCQSCHTPEVARRKLAKPKSSI